MVKYLAKFERWSFGVHYLHLKNVGSILLIIQHEITPLFLLIFDIKHKKNTFFNKHFPNNTKKPARRCRYHTAARHREKYYTKQFSKVGRSATSTIKYAAYQKILILVERPWVGAGGFLVFAARRILLPSPQLWFVPSRFRPCPTNLPTVKRPFHVG